MLELENLNVDFTFNHQIVQAVRGVSFSLAAGETIGIVGESGCGKSTLAKALLRLTPHTARLRGTVRYQGQDLLTFSEKEMRRVRGKEMSMIFQDPMTSLNPTQKIGSQIIEGYLRHHKKMSRKKQLEYAIHMLELVGIPRPETLVHAYPHTLSGGMRQRVMIALALAANPNILIADEPTTALDVTIQAQILDLLYEIQQRLKTSIVLITHDLSVVAHFCHRVLVMYAGKIVESAPTKHLFANPKHPYTKRLLASLPHLKKSDPLIPIDGSPPSLSPPPPGCAFCDRCHDALPQCSSTLPKLTTHEHAVACHLKEEA